METKFKFIKKLKNEKGFSLVELMVVVAIYWYLSINCYTKLSEVSA